MRNRIVLVTGAAGALGSAVAQAFSKTGAHLVLADMAADILGAVHADEVRSGKAFLVGGVDLTTAEGARRLAAEAERQFGAIDVLVNVAGGFRAAPLLEAPAEDWDFLFDLNARSVFHVCRSVAPGMRARGAGKIVNVGSPAALSSFATGGLYAASKAAVLRLTEALSAESKKDGVNVNAVLPGTMDTRANRQAMPDADPSTWVRTEEVADVIVFLASDAARAIHGASIPVYGRS